MPCTRRNLLTHSALLSVATAVGQSHAQNSSDAACTTEAQRLARNKKTVTDFYDMALNQSKPAEAIERFAGATYIQHNPEVADGKAGFIAYFNQLAKRYGSTGKRVEFIRCIAEADMVTAH